MALDHLSYSQYNSYTRCPRSWYLGKLKKAEEKQSWYAPIGTAVHQMIEDYLDESKEFDKDPVAEDFFYPLIKKQMLVEPDTSKWLAGGSKEEPIVEDLALRQVKECFEKAVDLLQDLEVLEVEYDASGDLPGLEVPLRAYVDIIAEHKKHGMVILDWKTGKNKPKDNFQLETYVALLNSGVYSNAKTALWGMVNPLAAQARPIDLSAVDPAVIGGAYQEVYDQMKAKIYKTNAGYGCNWCFQEPNCLLVAGRTDRALYFDKADEDGYPY